VLSKILIPKSTGKKNEIHTTKFATAPQNPYYIHTTSILYPYYGNIQLLWITKIHSISNKGPYNFHSMTLYGFSKFFPVIEQGQWEMGVVDI
jgi:hypothetical protein